MIIHLNGWPGVGKRTIGEALAVRMKARFVHNHLLHDVAIVCCGLGDPHRWTLYDQVRRAAYEALRERPRDEVLVMTNALCSGSARERTAWSHVVDLARDRQVALIPVVLEVELLENERRLRSAERIGRKMIDPLQLRSFVDADHIQKPDVPELLLLDVTELSPGAAAGKIVQHVSGLSKPLSPAVKRHRLDAP